MRILGVKRQIFTLGVIALPKLFLTLSRIGRHLHSVSGWYSSDEGFILNKKTPPTFETDFKLLN